ncbi:uncharacterized protein DDB_G0271670-like [Strongylocentrotus purpuratus]|uniref:Uncharacterized protein n=1 Tax=Strongylocentrotus purpuratus TaxID=7668 RepID=A0A7M7NYX1_STRPU|nr:uncharacterized protein DDB_G0271670-like [Strongylocentrotus purpuratus]|eukprot:XP_800560.1 PREDICTED: mucin-4 [Strongylocentrotus purpuratus]
MASGTPKSPRPGRKLTVAVNIPKPSSDSRLFLEPSKPTGRSPSSPLAKISSLDASENNSGPHPPRSPRPSTPNFHQVRSPYGSPNEHGTRPRRHTVSVVEPTKVAVPIVRHKTFPASIFHDEPNFGIDSIDDEADHEAENPQPLPASSSFFQQAMLDLKRRPSRSSQSSIDDEESTRSKGNATPSPRASHPLRSPPSIKISHIEEKNASYSLDIEFNVSNDDDDIFGSQGDENKLSSSAPDSFLEETRKSTILRLQLAKTQLSLSERALNQTSSKDPHKTVIKKNERTVPKSARRSKPGVMLSVDVSPLGGPLRKWRSTEGSLPALSTATPSRHHINHSPFLSSPMMMRKGSVPAVLSMPPKVRPRSSLQDLQASFKDGEQQGSPKTSSLSPRAAPSTKRPSSAHVFSTSTSTSSSSTSESSPTPTVRTKLETTDPPNKPTSRGHHHLSPISLKTANKITQFITSAAASSSISGSSGRTNLLPDTVTLPPVLDSSGRLRVHRRRDDSMRLVRQAVNSDHNEWMDSNDNQHSANRKVKSILGFAEV